MVLVWIIAGMIAAGIAGFAVTTLTGGKTPTPGQSPAGLTSSAAASSTSGGRGAPSVSGSASSSSAAARSASSSAGAAASSAQGTSQPASTSALRTRGYLPAGERVRVREPPLVRVSVSGPGLVYVRGPEADADADRSSTDIDAADHARDYGTPNVRHPQLRRRPHPRRRAQNHPHRHPRLGNCPR